MFDAIPKLKIPDCLKKVIQLKLHQNQHKDQQVKASSQRSAPANQGSPSNRNGLELSEMGDEQTEITHQNISNNWMSDENIRRHNVFDQIKAITDKSKCFDIFQKTKIYKYQMYP